MTKLNGIRKGNCRTSLLFFLFHTFTMLSKSPSDNVGGDSVVVVFYIKYERFVSPMPFLNLVLIIPSSLGEKKFNRHSNNRN